MSDGLVNLAELSELFGVAELTLRRWMDRDPTFPVLKRGSNGVAYQFDARAVKAWLDGNKAAREEAGEERRQELAQLQLELTGGSAAEGERVLTAKERREALEVAAAQAKWDQARGSLVPLAAMERAFDDALVAIRTDVMRIPERLRRLGTVSREDLATVDRECRQALESAAARVRHELVGDGAVAAE